MKLIYSLLGLIGLIILLSTLSSSAPTSQCYQETANISTSCGGLSTGNYSKIDYYWYMNYSVPAAAFNATWQVKHGADVLLNPLIYNISIPAQCFNNSIMSLRFFSNINTNFGESYGECLNRTSSSWITITQHPNISLATSIPLLTNNNEAIDGYWTSEEHYFQGIGWTSQPAYNAFLWARIYEEAVIWGMNLVSEGQTSYNNITYGGNQETFITNITTSGVPFSNYLIWNNTQYSGSAIALGGNSYTLSSTITIPQNITGNITWFWKMNFSTGDIGNLSNHTQEVRQLSIDNCGTFTNQVLNFTLYDEDSRINRINGTIELIINLWNNQRSALVQTFNNSYTVTTISTARVCIDNVNNNLSMDYQAKYYGNSSYVTEYKFAQAIPVTSTTTVQQINLYDLLDSRSTAFTISLSSSDLSKIRGAVVDVQRQYIPINQFISVESPLTNNDGDAVAHLVHNEVYYNFVVTQNGTLLGTFNNYLVQCQNFVTGDCRISLNLIQSSPRIPDFKNYGNITGAFTWSPSTRNLLFSFLSTDGLAHNVSWNVLKLDSWGNSTICTTSAVATTGTFSCTIPTIYGNSSIQTQVYSDGIFLGNSIFSLQPSPGSVFGGTRVVLAIVMYSTLTLMMIASPVTIIIGAVLGMIFAGLFHLVDGGSFIGNSSILLWFLIAAGVIIFYMRNKT